MVDLPESTWPMTTMLIWILSLALGGIVSAENSYSCSTRCSCYRKARSAWFTQRKNSRHDVTALNCNKFLPLVRVTYRLSLKISLKILQLPTSRAELFCGPFERKRLSILHYRITDYSTAIKNKTNTVRKWFYSFA